MTTITNPPTPNQKVPYKPKHEYFYQLYKELPPHKRNIRQLHLTLQKKEELPYQLPKRATLGKWSKEDGWEQRFLDELHLQYEHIDYEALETTKEFMRLDATVDKQHYYLLDDIQQQALQSIQQLANNNTQEQIKIAQSWSQLASQLMQVKKGLTSDYAETYSILKFLKTQNNITNDQQNILKEVGQMLGCDQDEGDQE